MLKINLFGGPGVGKSTLAAAVYAALKDEGINVELVREVVKAWAYEGKRPDEWDQIYTFGQQLYEEHRLAKAGVDVVVTDSPLLLQCFYSGFNAGGLLMFAKRYETLHNSINFLVERAKPYSHIGRFQSEADAVAMDTQMEAYMHFLELEHWHVKDATTLTKICLEQLLL